MRLDRLVSEEDFENFEDETGPTDNDEPTDMTTTTTIPTTNRNTKRKKIKGGIPKKISKIKTTPKQKIKVSDETQILDSLTKYPFTMAGYNPLLDLVITRIILLQIWKDDMAELQKTGLPRATIQAPNNTAPENDINIETFADMETDNKLYPQIYATFEDFFTAEFQNIPRLNIFIPRITNPYITREMKIILSTFAKPNWIIKITKYYRTEKIDGKTLNEFISDLSGDIPEDREGNSSNLVMNNEIGGLSLITVPIILRLKIDKVRAVLSQYVFNLDYEADPETAPDFSKETINILKFIVSSPTLIELLYMRLNDDETIEMLGLNQDDKDKLLNPTLVSDNRRNGAVGFANLLGYKSSMLYNITLLTNEKQMLPSGQLGSLLFMEHANYIKRLTKQSILQNPGVGLAIPNQAILDEKLTTITDNIYSYYFNIDPRYPRKYGEAFTKSGIFQFRLKPYLLPIYMDLPNYYLVLATKENELKDRNTDVNATSSNTTDVNATSSNTKLALEKEIDTIKKNINSLEKSTPYMIYLPLYDLQYIKIVLKQTKGELPVPNKYIYPDIKPKFENILLRMNKISRLPKLPSIDTTNRKNSSLSNLKYRSIKDFIKQLKKPKL
jgi:hypothetical protein